MGSKSRHDSVVLASGILQGVKVLGAISTRTRARHSPETFPCYSVDLLRAITRLAGFQCEFIYVGPRPLEWVNMISKDSVWIHETPTMDLQTAISTRDRPGRAEGGFEDQTNCDRAGKHRLTEKVFGISIYIIFLRKEKNIYLYSSLKNNHLRRTVYIPQVGRGSLLFKVSVDSQTKLRLALDKEICVSSVCQSRQN